MNKLRYPQFDFSAGIQYATSWILKKPNELVNGRNLRFNEEIGAFVRRYGCEVVGSDFMAGKTPTGGHTARFTTGAKRMVVTNIAGDASASLRVQDSSTGAWTSIITGLPPNVQLFFADYLDETYVTGYNPATGDPITPYNIDSSLNVSQTRNLLNAPAGYLLAEYSGALYMANVKVGAVRYPDRVYKSSPPLGAVTYVRGAQTGTMTSLKVDSVRYLKVGTAIDIYGAGTETKKYDITITAVDKALNTISFSSASITVADNDEIWIDGRKGKLTVLWNTDHPTPEESDFLAIQPGTDSDNAITGLIKSNNRLFPFTKNSITRYDGANFPTINTSIGCISHRTIRTLDDDWMIWLDATGRVWARNDSSGQQEDISRAIWRLILKYFPQASLKGANAIALNNQYRLYMGTLNGENIRVVYDFDSNTWAIDVLGKKAIIQIIDDYTGYVKPYFYSDDGKLYIDETGNKDGDKIISFEAELGRDMQGNEARKSYEGALIFSDQAVGLKLMASIEGGQFKTVGQIQRDIDYLRFPERGDNQLENGTDINYKIVGASEGDPQKIQGILTVYTLQEDFPSERR